MPKATRFRRGILRDFPTIYSASNGRRVEVAFDVASVTRDGKTETYATEKLANGVRLRIGRADVTVSNGTHEYVIKYRTTRQIGYFDDFDELYWNATGTGWTFPIDAAEARISLPEAVPFRQKAFYTGPQGSTRTMPRWSRKRPAASCFAPPSRSPPSPASPSRRAGRKACWRRRAAPASSSAPSPSSMTPSRRAGCSSICRR